MSDPRRMILLIEDNTDTTHQLGMLFRDVTDMAVAGAPTLADAREILRRDKPEYLMVDLQLPDGNGLDFVREARAACPECRIVVMTGYGDDWTRRLAEGAGADAFLVKPVCVKDAMTALGLEYPPKAAP